MRRPLSELLLSDQGVALRRVKKIAPDRLHRFAINRQQFCFQTAGVDIEILIRGRGDEPEQDRFTSINRNDFRIVKRVTVRQESIVFHVNFRFGSLNGCSN